MLPPSAKDSWSSMPGPKRIDKLHFLARGSPYASNAAHANASSSARLDFSRGGYVLAASLLPTGGRGADPGAGGGELGERRFFQRERQCRRGAPPARMRRSRS
ncbi:protein of unknown function [Methylacidimicrobium sp. AP8]|nr:protein of unknown function [Methylacidimicrobium sp. AP8]